ncbi:MAG: hypothetical protein IT330_13890 [Anaerolineae bacterium]|nr:hypothetical protein [Anaerolineae bacterium]
MGTLLTCAIIARVSEGRGKIITTLRQRRELEAALRGLCSARDDDELDTRAKELAQQGEPVLDALLRSLNSADPRLIGALGKVATHLDRARAAMALRATARDPRRADRERMSAILILDRFLHEEIEEGLVQGLRDPNAVARESLQEVMTEARHNRGIWLEYLEQLAEQPNDVPPLVMQIMLELDEEGSIEPLRLLAQDPNQAVAREAVRRLGSLRFSEAADALRSLLPTLPASLHPLAERALRKLQLSGVKLEPRPLPGSEWRALVTPVDGIGNRAVWLIGRRPRERYCRFLGLLLHEEAGIKEAIGNDHMRSQQLPPRRPLGSIIALSVADAGRYVLFLETTFDYAQRVILDSLARNFTRGTPTPSVYRLYNPYLWGYEMAVPPPTNPPASSPELVTQTPELLDHPAFEGWFIQTPALYDLAEETLSGRQAAPAPALARILTEYWDAARRACYRRRLEATCEWLVRAQEPRLADLTATAALTLEDGMPTEHPFLVRMGEIGLEVAMENLRLGLDLRRNPEEIN